MSNTEENIRYWVSLFPEYRDEKRISELLEKMLGKNIHQLAEEAVNLRNDTDSKEAEVRAIIEAPQNKKLADIREKLSKNVSMYGFYEPIINLCLNRYSDRLEEYDFPVEEVIKTVLTEISEISLKTLVLDVMNKSIFENITLNRDEITLDMVKEAAGYARVDDEIEAMPMKYNTIISDMGTNISGGQKQRIAIARALVNNPKLLFLDEATSSLDAINEHIISSYVQNCGCTQVVIAHRISTIMDADVIFVMNQGKLVEQGTHEELMNKNGLYSNLYHNQLTDLRCA